MDRQKFAFDKTNFILLAIGIKVAPAVCFFGFIFMIYGIVRKPKDKTEVVNS